MGTGTIEIVDEAGNVHGPFASHEKMMEYVESRALGDERHQDDENGHGWYMRAARTSR